MVTIIIATYNASKTIRVALNSVKKQSYTDWECIIVDGASKDGTIDIVKTFAGEDSRFRYVSEPDNGIYDAFNKGWKIAKGEWIYYLGADDELTQDGLSLLIKFADEENIPYSVIYGNVIYKRGNKLLYKKSKINVDRLRYEMICSHQALIMRKNALQKLGGFDMRYKISADFDLMQRLYLNGAKIHYVDVDIAYFNTNGASSNLHFEPFLIERRNKTIPLFLGVLLQMKFIIKIILRKIKGILY